jgi:hypothetical protein
MARDSRGWRNIVLESKIQDGLLALYDADDDYDSSARYQSINLVCLDPKFNSYAVLLTK